jgi:SAM-dependent methyltransferase
VTQGGGHTSPTPFYAGDAVERWRRGAAGRAVRLGPATELMLDLAGVGPGSRVLAVAAGTGEEAIAAAQRVGPTGSVLATDISAPMLQVAEAMAREAGLSNIGTQVADAQDLGIASASFDAVICRLGLHFLPDLARGLREMHRALTVGGKLAVIVWSGPAQTPFHSIFSDTVSRHCGAAHLTPTLSYHLGSPDVVGGAFRAAGFADVAVHPVGHSRHFPSAAVAVETLIEEFPTRRAAAEALNETDRAAALAEIEAGYSRFAVADGVEIPGEVLVAAGAR